jgi:hypothetical protein
VSAPDIEKARKGRKDNQTHNIVFAMLQFTGLMIT